MLTDVQHQERLRLLMERNPRIDRQKHLDDYQSCSEYLLGNKAPFNALFETAYKATRLYVCRNAGSIFSWQDKEDIISEVARAAIEDMGMFHGWSRYATWMKAIARYRIISFAARKSKEETVAVSEYEWNNIPAKSDMIQQWESTQNVNDMLSCLSDIDSFIVTGHVLGKRTFSQLAAETGLSLAAVNKKYRRALGKMRKIIC